MKLTLSAEDNSFTFGRDQKAKFVIVILQKYSKIKHKVIEISVYTIKINPIICSYNLKL